MRMPVIVTTMISSLLSLACAGLGFAQSSSYYNGTTTSGMFGQTTVGSSSSTTQGRTPTTSGTLGANGNTGGRASGGQVPQNVAATAQNTAPQVQLTQQRGAFVGADSADATNLRSLQNAQGANALGRGGAFGQNGLSQLRNLFAQPDFGGPNQNQSRPQIRVALKLGFKPQPVSAVRMEAFESRLTKLPGLQWVGPAEVRMEGRTAVLRGRVATEDDRELAEALAKMEPDVLQVRNEIVVVDLPGTDADAVPAAERDRSR